MNSLPCVPQVGVLKLDLCAYIENNRLIRRTPLEYCPNCNLITFNFLLELTGAAKEKIDSDFGAYYNKLVPGYWAEEITGYTNEFKTIVIAMILKTAQEIDVKDLRINYNHQETGIIHIRFIDMPPVITEYNQFLNRLSEIMTQKYKQMNDYLIKNKSESFIAVSDNNENTKQNRPLVR